MVTTKFVRWVASYPEQLYFMVFRKASKFNALAVFEVLLIPAKFIDSIVGLLACRVVDLSIGFDQTVVAFV